MLLVYEGNKKLRPTSRRNHLGKKKLHVKFDSRDSTLHCRTCHTRLGQTHKEKKLKTELIQIILSYL